MLDTRSEHSQHLEAFFRSFTLITLGVASISGIALIFWPHPTLAALFGSEILLVITLAIAWALSRGRRAHAAVLTGYLSLLVFGLAAVLVVPAFAATLALAPLIAVAIVLPYVGGQELRTLMVVSWLTVVLTMLLGATIRLFPPLPPALSVPFQAIGVTAVVAILLLLLWQFSVRLNANLARLHELNTALTNERAGLEQRVAERTADLQAALAEVQRRADEQIRLLSENVEQRATIRELSVPVLPVMHQTLVMPLIGAFDNSRLAMVQDRALQAIEHASARYLVIDITGVPVIDTAVASGLIAVIQAARFIGTETILVGVRPEVAQTIVGLGIDLGDLRTCSDLEAALRQVL